MEEEGYQAQLKERDTAEIPRDIKFVQLILSGLLFGWLVGFFCFLVVPMVCIGFRASDRTHAAAMTGATVVTIPDPQPPAPQVGGQLIFLFGLVWSF